MLQMAKSQGLRLMLAVLLISVLSACSAFGIVDDPAEEEEDFSGPPEVSIASPLAGDTYAEGTNVSILVRVTNAGDDIGRVALEIDDQIIAERTQPNPEGAPSFVIQSGWVAAGDGEHTLSVVASRLDGTTSDAATVIISVLGEATPEPTATEAIETQNVVEPTQAASPSPTATTQSSTDTTQDSTGSDFGAASDSSNQQQTDPEDPPEPTLSPTPNQPRVRVNVGANIRSGPGTVFTPPVGSLAANAEANILAVNPAGTWYKVQYYNGEGWIASSVVEVVGDTSRLPREVGPPTPIPATNTPAVTNTPPPPATAPDLSVVNVVVRPHPFVCNEASEIEVTIANSGDADAAGASFIVEDLYNGQVQATTNGVIGSLTPGGNQTAVVYLTVSTYISELHTTRIRVDPNNQVTEKNENNNANESQYTLAPGSC